MIICVVMLSSCKLDDRQKLEDEILPMYVVKSDTLASIIKDYANTYNGMISEWFTNYDRLFVMVECNKSGDSSILSISYMNDYFRDSGHSPVMLSRIDGIKIMYQETNGLSRYVKLNHKYDKIFSEKSDDDVTTKLQQIPEWKVVYNGKGFDKCIKDKPAEVMK